MRALKRKSRNTRRGVCREAGSNRGGTAIIRPLSVMAEGFVFINNSERMF